MPHLTATNSISTLKIHDKTNNRLNKKDAQSLIAYCFIAYAKENQKWDIFYEFTLSLLNYGINLNSLPKFELKGKRDLLTNVNDSCKCFTGCYCEKKCADNKCLFNISTSKVNVNGQMIPEIYKLQIDDETYEIYKKKTLSGDEKNYYNFIDALNSSNNYLRKLPQDLCFIGKLKNNDPNLIVYQLYACLQFVTFHRKRNTIPKEYRFNELFKDYYIREEKREMIKVLLNNAIQNKISPQIYMKNILFRLEN